MYITSKFERLIETATTNERLPGFYYYGQRITRATLLQIIEKRRRLALLNHPTKGEVLIDLVEAKVDPWIRTLEEGPEPSAEEVEQYNK